ncbi:hypothetical protein OGAPHI_004590 [Ogataea philodendri]|uniref:Uncharacterized protein n=1 Tax=Ogataea philodendri TaxID=1378263 RepID=A0A9P8P1T4_9ASCO|nr:uncharacterized protein OGAPHI_004590 [Ogataea philodendri]KAH3664238.1 hypothetical protein OGAPHI_004590 [Ogataea philodendri]
MGWSAIRRSFFNAGGVPRIELDSPMSWRSFISDSTSGYSTMISSTSMVSIWNPAFFMRVATSADSTNGETLGDNSPQRSSSAIWSADRSSNSVSPANIDPMKHPFGCSDEYRFWNTVGRSLIQCNDSMLLDESTMYIFPILDRTRCLSSLHLLSSSGLDSHSWRSKLPELHPKSMMLVNGVLRNARRSIDRLATSSRIYSTMVVVVGLLGLESLGQMARIRVQLLYELLELANLDSNLQVIRIGHRTLVVQFVEVTGEDVQNTLISTSGTSSRTLSVSSEIQDRPACTWSGLVKSTSFSAWLPQISLGQNDLPSSRSSLKSLMMFVFCRNAPIDKLRSIFSNRSGCPKFAATVILFVVLGEDLVEFNKNDPVLFVWPVSIVGPVFEQQFGVERSKKRYFLVWRDGHVVFDRVEGSQHQVEQHDGITQFRVELHDHGSE